MGDNEEKEEKDHFEINVWFLNLKLSGVTLDRFLPWLGWALVIVCIGLTIVWIIKTWRGEDVTPFIPDSACMVSLDDLWCCSSDRSSGLNTSIPMCCGR